jgi:hypothetical protein
MYDDLKSNMYGPFRGIITIQGWFQNKLMYDYITKLMFAIL